MNVLDTIAKNKSNEGKVKTYEEKELNDRIRIIAKASHDRGVSSERVKSNKLITALENNGLFMSSLADKQVLSDPRYTYDAPDIPIGLSEDLYKNNKGL